MNSPESYGAFPYKLFIQAIQEEYISCRNINQVRPGSFDLTVSDEGYRTNGAFLPRIGESVEQALKRVSARRISIDSTLERGCTYVFRLNEKILQPLDFAYGFCNPKSSSGRIDVHVRTLVDGVSAYDVIPKYYQGSIWLMIMPKSFSIVLHEGVSLNQLRLFNKDTRLNEEQLGQVYEKENGLLYSHNEEKIAFGDIPHSDKDGSLLLTLGLRFEYKGFEAIDTREPIELKRIGHYNPRCFFREVECGDTLMFQQGLFYILSTNECVRVPASFACEMRPMNERCGEFRAHYAGFIDPGWGMKKNNTGFGRTLTLEVRSFEQNFFVCHGQPIAKIRFERMIWTPEFHYDQMAPTYGSQYGAQLAKYFSSWR